MTNARAAGNYLRLTRRWREADRNGRARKGRIVELRFFGGLTEEETAEVIGISSPTVQREWRAAKAWLHRMLTANEHDERA